METVRSEIWETVFNNDATIAYLHGQFNEIKQTRAEADQKLPHRVGQLEVDVSLDEFTTALLADVITESVPATSLITDAIVRHFASKGVTLEFVNGKFSKRRKPDTVYVYRENTINKYNPVVRITDLPKTNHQAQKVFTDIRNDFFNGNCFFNALIKSSHSQHLLSGEGRDAFNAMFGADAVHDVLAFPKKERQNEVIREAVWTNVFNNETSKKNAHAFYSRAVLTDSDSDVALDELSDNVKNATLAAGRANGTILLEMDDFMAALKLDIVNPSIFVTYLITHVVKEYMNKQLNPPLRLVIESGKVGDIHVLDSTVNNIYVTKVRDEQHYIALEEDPSTAGNDTASTDKVKLVGVVYSNSEKITNFTELFAATANSLFVYNENVAQYNDIADTSEGAGNGVMRKHRLEQWRGQTPDGISNGALGIPTDATDYKIIDDSTQLIERTLNANPHVKYVFFSMDDLTQNIGVQTFAHIPVAVQNATYATAKLRNMMINGKKIVESDAIRTEEDFIKLKGTFGDPKPMTVLPRSKTTP